MSECYSNPYTFDIPFLPVMFICLILITTGVCLYDKCTNKKKINKPKKGAVRKWSKKLQDYGKK